MEGWGVEWPCARPAGKKVAVRGPYIAAVSEVCPWTGLVPH